MNQDQKSTIIFLHGTMGSVLTKKGRRVWPLITSDLKHFPKNLTPISDRDGIEPYDTIYISYNKIIKKLQGSGHEVVKRIYDWRKNNLEHLDLLRQDIESAEGEVIIIAHSMGGIIAKLCLNKFSELESMQKVKKLITIGTPWNGSMDAIKTLNYGTKIPEMSLFTLLTRSVSKLISPYFPSVYQLLPTKKYYDLLQDKNIISCEFNGNYYTEPNAIFRDLLKSQFDNNHTYNEVFNEYYELLSKDMPNNVEHHEVIGIGIPTISVICEKANKEPSAYWDDGDGTVPVFSAYSKNENPNYKAYFTKKTKHANLTKYEVILDLVDSIINNTAVIESENLFFSLDSPFYRGFNGYIQKVACPVDISLTNNEGQIIYGEVDAISEDDIREIMNHPYEISTLGTTTYILYDEDSDTNISNYDEIIIKAYDKGPTSVSIDKFESSELIERNAFATFDIDPSKHAIVKLEDNVKESKLILKEDNEEIENFSLNSVEIDDEKIILPVTQIGIEGNNIIISKDHENCYFIKNNFSIKVNSVTKGTFDVHKTFVEIADKTYALKEDEVIEFSHDMLQEGKNNLRIYSIDIYDNTEKEQTYDIYYVNQSFDRIELLFTQKAYSISIKESSHYEEIADLLSFKRVDPNLIFDNTDGVTRHLVVYDNITRNVTLELTDAFNENEEIKFKINEELIKQVIRGTANAEDLKQVLKDFGLVNPVIKYDMKGTGNKGNHSTVNKENLDKCKGLTITDIQGFDIKINKDVAYDVKFGALTERINIEENKPYQFNFTVHDKSLSEYLTNLDLKTTLEVDINGEKLIDEFNVKFSNSNKHYYFELRLEKAKEFISKFWSKNDDIIADARLYISYKHNDVKIRNLDLSFEKNV